MTKQNQNQIRSAVLAVLLVGSIIGPFVSLPATASTDTTAVVAAGDEEWTHNASQSSGDSASIRSAPTIVDGVAYFTSVNDNSFSDGTVHAVYTENGSTKWTYSIGNMSFSTPHVAGGTVYVGTHNDSLLALNADTGVEEWEFTSPSDVIGGSAVYHNGTVYAGSSDQTLYAVNATSGDQEWAFTTPGGTVYNPTVQNGTIYVGTGDGNVYGIDAATGSEEWSTSIGPIARELTVVNGTVFAGSYSTSDSTSEGVTSLNASDGSVVWSNTADLGEVRTAPTVHNGAVYVTTYNGSSSRLAALDEDTGSVNWEFTNPTDNIFTSPTVAGDNIYFAANDGDVYAVDSSGSQAWTYSTTSTLMRSDPTVVDGSVMVGDGEGYFHSIDTGGEASSEGSRIEDATFGHIGDAGPTSVAIGGQVIDQNGDPVPANTTVEVWGVAEPALNTSDAESLEQQADDLLDDLENPLPNSWNESYDLEEHQSGTYLLVHEADDWGREYDLQNALTTDQIDDPKLQTSSEQPVIISVWDATDRELVGNPVINSFPGTPEQQSIVVEQLSPSGEVTNRQTYESEVVARTGNQVNQQEHHGVRTQLPSGVYRVYPEGAPEQGYTFVHGDADELANRIEQDLRDEHEQLTDRADRVRTMVNNDEVVRRTTTTDENGSFSVDVPDNVVTVQMQAYRVDGEVLQNTENVSMDTLRDAAEGDYNGSFILPSPEPDRANPPAQNVTVKTIKSPEVPNLNMSSYADLLEWAQNLRLNETIADLEAQYEQRLENVTRAQLVSLYNNSRSLVEGYPPALEYYLNETGYEEVPEPSELSNEELRTQIDKMQSASFQANRIDMGDAETSVEEVNESLSTISGSFPVPDGVDEENVAVEIVWSNGTVQQMPDEYWELSDGGLVGSQSVEINEFPIETTDAAVANVRVRAASEDGVGEETARIVNPQFSGDVPNLNAIDVNTLRPGVDERVTFQLRAESGTGYGQIEAVDVYAPDGTVVNATIRDNGRVSFTPESQGSHFVRAQYSNQGGDPFVETFSLRAEESSTSQPPTIRARRGPSGTHALAGEGLRSARVEENGDRLTVSGVIPGGENAPGKVVVEPQSVMQSGTDEIEVRVLRGEDRETVRSHMAVEIHTETFEDSALLWVNDNAFTHDGTTQYGAVDERGDNKHVIQTRTNAQGVAVVEITRDPGYYDRARHWMDRTLPDINPFMIVDFIFDLFGGLPTEVVTTGLTAPAAEPQNTVATTSPTTGVAA
ncbi:PQQ-binding-like beta-propeller repeat protein [Halostella sp. JP-L12]|nr:PQQ-binding-like beta-propeller repeat protein [Halostella sp. JP-L12]